MSNNSEYNTGGVVKSVSVGLGLLALVFVFFLACYVIYKPIHRYQKRADAANLVSVTKRLVNVRRQEVEVQKQEARVQRQVGKGQKNQNQEIAKQLTPLFVQYAMTKALEDIATSGSNNTVVFIPVGANGVPLVSNTNVPQVLGGENTKK